MNGTLKVVPTLVGAVLAVSAAAAITVISPASAMANTPDGCPGGYFCGWDGPNSQGAMVAQFGPECVGHDIGQAGQGDRITSYRNRTGKTVKLYNWADTHAEELATIPDDTQGTLPHFADNRTDLVNIIC
jgi:hypothetical protein